MFGVQTSAEMTGLLRAGGPVLKNGQLEGTSGRGGFVAEEFARCVAAQSG